MHIQIVRRVDDQSRTAVNALLEAAETADGRHPLSDQSWLDFIDGGRPGFVAITAWPSDASRAIGYTQVSRADNGTNVSIDFVVHPDERRESAQIGEALLRAALDEVRNDGGGLVHLWISHPTPMHDDLATRVGLASGRELYQMRRTLPVDEAFSLDTRPFVPGRDDEEWVEVNNRAFDWHPEQGGWTLDSLQRRQKEPWFDPVGFLVHEREGRIAGFCWTKIHDDVEPTMGEIYVIAVNPDFQGLGLGRGLVLAGLDSIYRRHVTVGMLYVDAANTAAVTLYQSLGFTVDHIDRAYVATLSAH